MECQFLGGAGEVTGSMHVLNTGQDQILMDCGMFQGRRKESNEKTGIFLWIRQRSPTWCYPMLILIIPGGFPC